MRLTYAFILALAGIGTALYVRQWFQTQGKLQGWDFVPRPLPTIVCGMSCGLLLGILAAIYAIH